MLLRLACCRLFVSLTDQAYCRLFVSLTVASLTAYCGLFLLADLCGLPGLAKPASLDSCSSKTPCFIAGLLTYLWLT